MMIPVKVATLRESFIERVAARGCQMQGLPEVRYHLHPARDRHLMERGVRHMFEALESLGCVVMAPAELSPVIENPDAVTD